MLALFTILGTTLTVLQAFGKWGWLEKYEFLRSTWMPEAGCFLCLSFWLSIPVSLLYFTLWLFHVEFLLIPFTCAGLINIILRK
jgi:hypothetical protein